MSIAHSLDRTNLFPSFELPNKEKFQSTPRILCAITTILAIGIAVGAYACLENDIQLVIKDQVLNLEQIKIISALAAGTLGIFTVGTLFIQTSRSVKPCPLHAIFGDTPKKYDSDFEQYEKNKEHYSNTYNNLLNPKKKLSPRDLQAYISFIDPVNSPISRELDPTERQLTPVFHAQRVGPNHHALLCRDPNNHNKFYYIDSDYTPNESNNRAMTEKLKKLFPTLNRSGLSQEITIEFPQVPQQGDDINCGLFVMVYAKLFAEGISWDDIRNNQLVSAGMATELRRHIAIEIATGKPLPLDKTKNASEPNS
jgi:hypothetical protein